MTNKWEQVGAGAIGLLPEPMALVDFLDHVKSQLGITHLKYTDLDRQVQRIAVGGGTCSFLIDPSKRAGADVLVTADIKYHEWFEADGQIAIVDIGHYESEIHTIEQLASLLSEKFPNIAVRLTTVITNPVKHH
jgi:putative NIF3 family GTP cyclohydrolase 1 type 2